MAKREFGNFNPHSHAGSDDFENGARLIAEISIHTPMQGVTEAAVRAYAEALNFNPHSHAGSDHLDIIKKLDEMDISIHTPMQGVTEM